MTQAHADTTAAESPATARRHRFTPSLALAAFIMSLGTTAVTIFYALRGAEVVALPPQQLIFYRDGEGESSVLMVLAKVDMINTTSAYGDVLLGSELAVSGAGKASFAGTALATPIFRADGTTLAAADCSPTSRCVRLPGLTVVEEPSDVPDLPGGSGTSLPLVHAVTQWNCASDEAPCARYDSFDRALDRLGDRFTVEVVVRLHEDGVRRFRCQVALDRRYLKQVGWASVPCGPLPTGT